jgi:hypothetical protein
MEGGKGRSSAAPAPGHMAVYRTEGVFQRLHLCEYLRELPEDPATTAEETKKEANLPSPCLPAGR